MSEVAESLAGFEGAFRAGVPGQQDAYAGGGPPAVIDAFMASRGGGGKN
jgi:hypothetical protein